MRSDSKVDLLVKFNKLTLIDLSLQLIKIRIFKWLIKVSFVDNLCALYDYVDEL